MKISREFKIGLLVVTAICVLVWGINYLKGLDLFDKNREYTVYYKNSENLVKSNPVMYNGMQVGLVESVTLMPGERACDDSMKVVFTISEDKLRLIKGAEARIESDLLGSKSINIVQPNCDSIAGKIEHLAMGERLIGTKQKSLSDEVSEQVLPLKIKVEGLIGTVDSLVTSISSFWDAGASKDMSESVAGVRRAILTFEKTATKIDTLIASERARLSKIFINVEAITKNIADSKEEITKSVENIATFSDELSKVKLEAMIAKAEKTFDELNLAVNQINSGEGTVGQLIYGDSLHNELIETNAALQLLLNDFRQYPNRYFHFSVFGGREKTPKLNSNEEKYLKQMMNLKDGEKLIRFSAEEEKKLLKLLE